MKNSSKKFLTIIAAAVLSLAQYGCLSDLLAPTADPTVFHVISPAQIEKKYDCKCKLASSATAAIYVAPTNRIPRGKRNIVSLGV